MIRSELADFRKDLCDMIRADIEPINRDIQRMSERIDRLEGADRHGCGSSALSEEDLLEELEERNNRALNLIMFSLDEPAQTDDSRISDAVLVKDILQSILPDGAPGFEFSRLGEKRQGRSRSLRVTLPTKKAVLSVLRNKRRYTGPAKIRQDMTPRQRNHLADLRVRLQDLRDAGENKTIRYIGGVPRIISDLRSCSEEYVSLGDGTKHKVIGHGTVYIKRSVNDQWIDGRLEDVLYVPGLNKNLFSVGACVNRNYKAVFKDNFVELFLQNQLMARGIKHVNNIFYMLFKVRANNDSVVRANGDACLAATTSLKRWHERLGHVNYKCIRQMRKDGLIKESHLDNAKEDDLFCEACQYGKLHRFAFKPSTHEKPLPADVLDRLKDFVNLIENKFQRRVKSLRVDNGKEYCNEATIKRLRLTVMRQKTKRFRMKTTITKEISNYAKMKPES
ncbi:hypothetical protein DMN91_008221 [Ooceraea biroi]|uniref:Uncharacterized protein n=1 Tax=Ooceraea biroi TaxID=2015173 RepID=A0A3L8DGV7_OOCBI|nr:hypothetical protein DMN91_008221 [Ooceraea biroi]